MKINFWIATFGDELEQLREDVRKLTEENAELLERLGKEEVKKKSRQILKELNDLSYLEDRLDTLTEVSEEEIVSSNKLKPGRELDRLIVERVFNLKFCECSRWSTGGYLTPKALIKCDLCNDYIPQDYPTYSTDIAAAWEVVARLQSITQAIEIKLQQNYMGHWICEFKGQGDKQFYGLCEGPETPMHAICLAALEAVG